MYDIRNKQITFNPMDGHHPSNIGNKASDHATNGSNQKQSLELPLNKSFYNYSFNHLSMLHIYIYICIYIYTCISQCFTYHIYIYIIETRLDNDYSRHCFLFTPTCVTLRLTVETSRTALDPYENHLDYRSWGLVFQQFHFKM